jgi:hypothetical protein
MRGAWSVFNLEFEMKNDKVIFNSKEVDPESGSMEVAEINLGYCVSGKYGLTPNGKWKVAGEVDRVKWVKGLMFAVCLARLLELVHKLEIGSIFCLPALVGTPPNEVEAQVTLICSNAHDLDTIKTKAAICGFTDCVASQKEMVADKHDLRMDEETIKTVKTQAAIFLESKAGEVLSKQMLIKVEGQELTSVAGSWARDPLDELKPAAEKIVQCFYDGRRLRTKTLFFVEANPRAKALEVIYDESRFDEQIKGFADNKDVMLEIVYQEVREKKSKSTLILKSMIRLPESTAFELK